MYTPSYDSALFMLDAVTGFEVDYSEYVSGILRRKHYGQTGKYRR